MIDEAIEHFTYLGIFTVLFVAGLGVPIPEEIPVLAAGVLAHHNVVRWWMAIPVCLAGVLSGDVILYWTGWHWGEQILNWRVVRLVLSPEREHALKTAYRQHAVKTIFIARHVVGVRAAAFLTAGIARISFWKFLLSDGVAALVGVPLGFGLAYFFTDQLDEVMRDVHRVERWLGMLALVVATVTLAVIIRRRSRRDLNT